MAAPKPIPEFLRHGPFTREQGLQGGLTEAMFKGGRLKRLHPRVWVDRSHDMSDSDWILAARLAMPARARTTSITRIRELGLDLGPVRPFHFVVDGDLHIDLEDIFLHRTVVMPPCDELGVSPAAAFIAYAATARVIDAVQVGDWLLRHGHVTLLGLRELAMRDSWRPGAREAQWVSRYLDGDSRSMTESETRAILVFAGLPEPRSNTAIADGPRVWAYGDLGYRRWKLIVEYEGSQHLLDREQWNSDIDRYAAFRERGINYVQVTKEKLRAPRTVVSTVYRQLLKGGYDGPAPTFDLRWKRLFGSLSVAALHRGGDSRSSRSPAVDRSSPRTRAG